jgi:hypothetical protein
MFIQQGSEFSDRTVGFCPKCGHRRFIPWKFWLRKSKPMCACGTYLELSKRARKHAFGPSKEAAQAGRCERCNAVLRSGNETTMCAPCTMSCQMTGRVPETTKVRKVRKIKFAERQAKEA